jgi:hypothetical protein
MNLTSLSRFGALVLIMASLLLPAPVAAVSDPYDPSNVISDAEFNDTASMSCGTIQDFLNQRTGILKSYVLEGKTAAQLICEQSRRFKINPRIILVLLQKEQGMLGDNNPNQSQMDWAVGCAPGWSEARGLVNQFECAARTFRNRFDAAVIGDVVAGIKPANRATIALLLYNNNTQGNRDFSRIWTHYWPATGSNMAPTQIFVDPSDLEATPAIKAPCRSGWLTGTYGFSGINLVTPNAAGKTDSTNSAIWRPTIQREGAYQVSVFIPARKSMPWPCGDNEIVWDTSHARYAVNHRDGVTTYEVDQAPLHDEWVNIGTYFFTKGGDGYVFLTDQTGEESMTRYVSFDEARWVWVGQ